MSSLSRRVFAQRLAFTVAAPFILDDLPPLELGAPSRPAPAAPAAPPAAAPPPSELARALTEAVRIRYGDRLSAADLDIIAQRIEARLQGLERLYQVPLSNGDEPDFVFSVYRGDP
jgi:hypothetical protein